MQAEPGLNKILSQVKKLNKLDQAALLKKIAAMLQVGEQSGKTVKLSDLSGLGSSVWHNVDIDRYVDDQRQW